MAIDPRKHRFFLLDRQPTTYGTEHCTVLYMHKDRKGLRAKMGQVSLPFSAIYGVSVYATFDGRGHWALSADMTDKTLQGQLEELFSTGELPLPLLTTEEIMKDYRP